MTLYDLYLISPQLAVASTGILVILLDLVFQRKGFLPYAAFAGLLVSLTFLVIQSVDLAGAVNLVDAVDSGAAGVLAGSLAVDRFSLFFNYLVLAALGLVTLASVDYVRRIERFRGEYFGLLLFSATGMMLLASATELITHLHLLGAHHSPTGGIVCFLDDIQIQRSRDEIPYYWRDQLCRDALRNGLDLWVHGKHPAG